ncbi:thioredoxin family protein [Candidatus Gottesmanbacteria bacterium]|nr:thioredoxin family protein [Candidatus Gottesmanbacteria bacterium]
MNKTIVTAGIIILIVIGGGIFFANQQLKQTEQEKMAKEKSAMQIKEDAAMKEQQATEKKEDGKTMADKTSVRYVEYSKTVLDGSVANRRVLFFYANWCPVCKPADVDFQANSDKIPSDVTVIRVNYNDSDTDQEEKDLAKKYGITYQHTFVQIDTQGKEVAKWNGGKTDELLAKIK